GGYSHLVVPREAEARTFSETASRRSGHGEKIMSLFACSSEKEVQAALRQGHWPHACDPDLRAHVNGCRDCHELFLVTQSLQKAKANGERLAGTGSPGLLWWRAQLRRRNEAIECVTEPLALAERAGLFGLVAAFCVLLWQGGQSG